MLERVYLFDLKEHLSKLVHVYRVCRTVPIVQMQFHETSVLHSTIGISLNVFPSVQINTMRLRPIPPGNADNVIQRV